MDEEIERLVVSVRADTRGFASDVATMRGELDGPLASGVDRAGRMIERSLVGALAKGRLGFDDLKRTALSAMGEIAAASLRGLLGGGGGGGQAGAGGGGLGAILSSAIGSAIGLPGRATGGPVSAGRGYMVGERGPELFVPERAGRIEPAGGGGSGRSVRVAIALHAPRGVDEPRALQQSARQVARAVKRALA